MLRKTFIILAALLFASGVCVQAAKDTKVDDRRVIQVAPFADDVRNRTHRVDGIPERCRTALEEALLKTGRFRPAVRDDPEKQLSKELQRQWLTGDFDPKTARRIGQKLGADFIAQCWITENELAQIPGGLFGQHRMKLRVEFKLADVETAEWVLAERPWVELYGPPDIQTQAVNQVACMLAYKILDKFFPVKVVSIEGGKREAERGDKVFVNVGSTACMETGVMLAIRRPGDGDTGYQEKVGLIRVIDAQEKVAKAEVVEVVDHNRPIETGDRVALTSESSPPPPVDTALHVLEMDVNQWLELSRSAAQGNGAPNADKELVGLLHLWLGLDYLRAGQDRVEETLKELQRAVDFYPNCAEAQDALAKARSVKSESEQRGAAGKAEEPSFASGAEVSDQVEIPVDDFRRCLQMLDDAAGKSSGSADALTGMRVFLLARLACWYAKDNEREPELAATVRQVFELGPSVRVRKELSRCTTGHGDLISPVIYFVGLDDGSPVTDRLKRGSNLMVRVADDIGVTAVALQVQGSSIGFQRVTGQDVKVEFSGKWSERVGNRNKVTLEIKAWDGVETHRASKKLVVILTP